MDVDDKFLLAIIILAAAILGVGVYGIHSDNVQMKDIKCEAEQ